MAGFFTAPRVSLGVGAIEQLSGLGIRRALLLADPNAALSIPRKRVQEELAKSDTVVELMDGAPSPPREKSLAERLERTIAFGPDWIVALGGGSTVDLAKGLWVGLERPGVRLDSISPLTDLGLRQRSRLVAIPTTSGSGAEASWSSAFRRDDGTYFEIASRELVADWVLLDPQFPRTLPPSLAVEGAIQTLAHACEALASEWGNPFSAALAKEALSVAFGALPKLARHPEEELREQLHYAATLAGIAVANAQAGLAQAIARVLVAPPERSFGRLLGAILPSVVEFNFPAARERYLTLAPILGSSSVAQRGALAERLRSAVRSAGAPTSLRAVGISQDDFETTLPEIVRRVARTPAAVANPRLASSEELHRLLRAAFDGSPVSF